MKSEKLDQIAAALSATQAEMKPAPMTRENPFLKNKYADLADIIKTAAPVLAKHGLAVSQQVVTDNGQVGVTTTLLHASGQWIESTVSLPLGDEKGKSLAQVAGSIITYLRRYSYGSIIGLSTDEDTDGNGNGHNPKQHEQPDKPYTAGGNSTAPMSLEFAESKTNKDGVKYGTLDTATISHMANSLGKITPRTDEQERKLAACKVILAHRASGQGA